MDLKEIGVSVRSWIDSAKDRDSTERCGNLDTVFVKKCVIVI